MVSTDLQGYCDAKAQDHYSDISESLGIHAQTDVEFIDSFDSTVDYLLKYGTDLNDMFKHSNDISCGIPKVK